MGYFITFEGVEGCGKTTLIESFGKYLREEEKEDIIITKEPGEGNFGREIREILKYKDYNLSPITQLYLFLADRQNHIEKFITPYLDMNYIILCDRYTESTAAYQGFGSRLATGPFFEFEFGNIITTKNFLIPDLTILLDIDCNTGLERKGNENDNFHKLDMNYHNRVRDGYLEMFSLYKEDNLKCAKMIDASQSKNEVLNNMKEIWKEFINE